MSETNPVDPTSSSAPAPASVAAAAPAPAALRKRRTRFITPALALVAALVVGGVGGVLIGQNTAAAAGPSATGPGGFANGGGPRFQGGGAGGPGGAGGLTAGTIESIDGGTITVKLADGSTVQVTTTADTSVTQSTDAVVGDLATGDTITVIGQKDDSGNVAADSISEGEALRFGGPAQAPSDSTN